MVVFRLIILLTLGLLFSPSQIFACGSKHYSAQQSFHSAISCQGDCCMGRTACSDNHKRDKQCSGKCGHSSCHCPSISGIGFALLPIEVYSLMFTDYISETLKFGYIETFFNSAVDSLRLPPKIG